MQGTVGTPGGDYWLGLNAISTLSMTGLYKMVVTFVTLQDNTTYMANYDTFTVGGASTNYQLTIGGYSSNFTFDAFSGNSGYTFETYDQPTPSGANCAAQNGGAWWYGVTCMCNPCLTGSTPSTPFGWNLGFTPNPLLSDKMWLVCM